MRFNKYKGKQHPLLKREDDGKNFRRFFNFIMIKNIEPTHKLTLNLMCNDLWLNGQLQWKQETYADNLGMSRRQIVRLFKQYQELGILIPGPDNKRGGKKNVYSIEFNNISKLEKGTKKPVTSKEHVTPVVVDQEEVHVTPEASTCDMGGKTHVTPVVETCDTDVTYTNNTNYIQTNTNQTPSFSSCGSNEEEDLDTFLDGLDIEFNHTYKKQNDTSTIQQQGVTDPEVLKFANELDI